MFIWTISDAIGVILALLFLFVFCAVGLHRAFTVWRCKHDGDVHETRACDAICNKCGGNLGFIGTWRKSAAPDKGEK